MDTESSLGYRIVGFAETHVPQAARLFSQSYARERTVSPLLPRQPMGDESRIAALLAESVGRPGVVALSGGEMAGYLCTSARFPWKGLQASLCREHAHAAVGPNRALVYQLMYAALAEEWLAAESRLHLVCHFAGDAVLRETLFWLGFGAIVAENLRDLSPVPGGADVRIIEETDLSRILGLAGEHRQYYRASPIFLPKGEDELPALLGSENAKENAVFVFRPDDEAVAYFIVGPCRGRNEGLLLGGTNTAQILSAYARPDARGRGIGKSLLAACVQWAGRKGHDRVFVEHETANIWGGNFWRRHFSPYLYASMRYVDSTL